MNESKYQFCSLSTTEKTFSLSVSFFRTANKFQLSTSQVATSSDSFMGYGPVEPDGYGASYNPKNDQIIFCLSAFWSSEVTSTSKFAQSLEESLNIMQTILSKPTNKN